MDWIVNGGVAFFIAWNWWSVVAISAVIASGFVLWRALAVPSKSSPDRVAYDQNRTNIRESRTPIRRLVITCFIGVFALMASVIFCIAVYNMLK